MSWNISWGYIKLTSRTERIITKNVSGEKDIDLNDLKTKHRESRLDLNVISVVPEGGLCSTCVIRHIDHR